MKCMMAIQVRKQHHICPDLKLLCVSTLSISESSVIVQYKLFVFSTNLIIVVS